MRQNDIEALRNKMKLEGRPLKSGVIIDKDGRQIQYTVKKDRVSIKEITKP